MKKRKSAEPEYNAVFLETESEINMAVEIWMTDAAHFRVPELEADNEKVPEAGGKVTEIIANADKEKKHEVPGLKNEVKGTGFNISGARFGRRTFILLEIEDPILELEHWMVDEQVWNIKR